MKKFCFLLIATFFSLVTIANAENFEYVNDGQQLTYNKYNNTWIIGGVNDDDIILYKKLYEGAGSYSQYLDANDKIAFTLTSSLEFVKDGTLYAINNDELKYYKIRYNGETIEEVPLTYFEIQDLFPDAEIISLSLIDDDNKMWIHKQIGAKKKILFVSDGDKYYYRLTPKNISIQDENIKGLITISYYGIYRFTHFGQRDGKLTIYVR